MLLSTVSGPLRVVVKSSRLAFYYLLLAHGVALWALLQAGLYIALIGLIISFVYYVRQWRRRIGVRLIQVQTSSCLFEFAQGVSWQGSLGVHHFISEFLLVIQVQRTQHRCYRYLVLFRDALSTEDFRRLRVLLLFPDPTLKSSGPGSSLGLK